MARFQKDMPQPSNSRSFLNNIFPKSTRKFVDLAIDMSNRVGPRLIRSLRQGSSNDSDTDPLDVAQGIQRNRGRECHKRPAALPRIFHIKTPPPEQKQPPTVNLCASNSGTETDSDKRKTHQHQQSTRKRRLRKPGPRKSRETVPTYPRSYLADENDISPWNNLSSPQSIDSQGEENAPARKHCKRQMQQRDSLVMVETTAPSHREDINEQQIKLCEEQVKIWEDNAYRKKKEVLKSKAEQEKTGSETTSELDNNKTQIDRSFAMTIPALKSSACAAKTKKKTKKRCYHDVKDMGDDRDDCSGDTEPSVWIQDMKKHVDSAEATDKDHIYNDDSIPKPISVLSFRKVNNKQKIRAKLKRAKIAKKIVPGSSLGQTDNRQQHDEKEHSLRTKSDQDEYHTSKEKAQGTEFCHDALWIDWR